jgi:hypothetical protein
VLILGVVLVDPNRHQTCGRAQRRTDFLEIDFATSRAQSMKRFNTGLKLRFLNVVMSVGQVTAGMSTGRTFTASRSVAN